MMVDFDVILFASWGTQTSTQYYSGVFVRVFLDKINI